MERDEAAVVHGIDELRSCDGRHLDAWKYSQPIIQFEIERNLDNQADNVEQRKVFPTKRFVRNVLCERQIKPNYPALLKKADFEGSIRELVITARSCFFLCLEWTSFNNHCRQRAVQQMSILLESTKQ